jgi:hypothetical protein
MERKAALSGSSGAAGGYTVPIAFAGRIMALVAERSFLRPRALRVPVQSRELLFPLLEVSSAQAAGVFPFLGGAGAAGGNGGAGQGGGIFNDGPSPFGAPDLTLTHSLVEFNQADGGTAGAGGSSGSGQGSGVYVTAGSTASKDQKTAIAHNHASTSDDDVFGSLS